MSSTQKRIVVHLGAPKTGSSAVQTCLQHRGPEIIAQGLFIPRPVRLHHRLATSFIRDETLNRRKDFAYINELPLTEIQNKLNAFCNSDDGDALISSEYFYMCDPTEIMQFFKSMNIDPHVIFFCREQAELLASGYNQEVKRLEKSGDIALPASENEASAYNWLLYYERLVDVFGVGRVWFFDYAIARRFDGGVVPYFLSKVGDILGKTISVSGVEEFNGLNRSLNLYALNIKRYMNSSGRKDLQPLLDYADTLNDAPNFELTTRQTAQIHAIFRDSNEELVARVRRDGAGELLLATESGGTDVNFDVPRLLGILERYFRDVREQVGLLNTKGKEGQNE